MAAYAALVSLMNTINAIQNHPRLSTCLPKKQVESLSGKIDFLLDFVEKPQSHGFKSEEAHVLESQVASAAKAAEDVIESHIVDLIHSELGYKGMVGKLVHSMRMLFSRKKVAKEFQTTIQGMDCIKKIVLEFQKESGSKDNLQPKYSMTPTNIPPASFATDKNNAMVGFDEQLIELMDKLTRQPANRQIIPVVGMGGIGKTTLAKTAYERSLIVQYFDIRTWATVSQTYNVRQIFQQLLSDESKSPNEANQEPDEQLGERLYKKLFGRRYLIVLDDIWSVEAWDKVKAFFPENENGSRIVVTTRITNLGVHFGSSCLELTFLDEDKSWRLFCETTFGGAGCPPELEDTAREIAKKCKGLPISIVVIGGLLGRSPMTQEYWKSIAKDLIPILNAGENEDCLNVLSLSYTHLPAHLKPCFLYMGIFREDDEIRVSQLIKLWVAEGFIKSNKTQSLEEIARSYLNDLIDRNLILKNTLGSNGKIRFCKVHDLLRDLCLKIAEKEKFIYMMMKDIPLDIEMQRCIVLSEINPEVGPALQSTTLTARSLVVHKQRGPLSFNNRLLRILNVFRGEGEILLEEIFDQVNLRCLRYYTLSDSYSRLPSSISLLWNLQTLIITGTVSAPSQIWEMRQLRHLNIFRLYLPDPPMSDQHSGDFALINLQTLKAVRIFTLSDEVCKGVLNVEKLSIVMCNQSTKSSNDYCLYGLGRLQKLKSLRCTLLGTETRGDLLQNLTTLTSLRKLAIQGWKLRCEDLTVISTLPHLEVLKLHERSVEGPVWNPVEGEFLRLKLLSIKVIDLVSWNADSSHFPVLEKLLLQDMAKLDEIPLDVGEIPTLRVIDLCLCSESAAISALEIAEEQENAGNEELQIRVRFMTKEQADSFREKVTSNNFHVSYYY